MPCPARCVAPPSKGLLPEDLNPNASAPPLNSNLQTEPSYHPKNNVYSSELNTPTWARLPCRIWVQVSGLCNLRRVTLFVGFFFTPFSTCRNEWCPIVPTQGLTPSYSSRAPGHFVCSGLSSIGVFTMFMFLSSFLLALQFMQLRQPWPNLINFLNPNSSTGFLL